MSRPLSPDSWKALLAIGGVFVLSVWVYEFINQRPTENANTNGAPYDPTRLPPGRTAATFSNGPLGTAGTNDLSHKGGTSSPADQAIGNGATAADNHTQAVSRRYTHSQVHVTSQALYTTQGPTRANPAARPRGGSQGGASSDGVFPTIDDFEVRAIERQADGGWSCEVTWKVSGADDIQLFYGAEEIDETTTLSGSMTFDDLPEGAVLSLRAFRLRNEVDRDATLEPPPRA